MPCSEVPGLIIGSRDDEHVVAVIDALHQISPVRPVVVDAPSLRRRQYSLSINRLTLDGIDVPLDAGFGWLRRQAPSGWLFGDEVGGLDALVKRSFIGAVIGMARFGGRRWLTSVDAMIRAEDKLLQLQLAEQLGIDVPDTVVASRQEDAHDHVGDPMVVKPLMGGYFTTREGPKAVFASLFGSSEADEIAFAGVPMLAQEHLHASRHLRVVTVGDRAWVAELTDVDGPIDWRQVEANHRAWRSCNDARVAGQATQLAAAFNIGYSSQDWIETAKRLVFVDLNPGGQWLFLPESTSTEITRAIARFLVDGRSE